MRILYSFLWYLFLPLVVLRLFFLAFKNPGYLHGFFQRFGFVSELSDDQKIIWLHAVSVGEVQASKSLVIEIQKNYPELKIVITTGTPTGAETVKQLFGDQVTHLYQPYDVAIIMRRFLKKIKPKLILVMETELWPNMFHYCAKFSIPLVLVNARMSERSAKRYARVATLTQDLFLNTAAIAVQTDEDARRMENLGALTKQLHVTGSIKFDISVDEEIKRQVNDLKQTLFQQRPIWIAASTHEGEEKAILDAHKKVLKEIPDCLLILAPRHPVRADEIIELIKEQKLNFSTRSSGQQENSNQQVFLLDTLGELMVFYGIADIAFIGGSLVSHGGHNPIEPASFRKPILIGPHDFNFLSISTKLIDQGGALRVQKAGDLASMIVELLRNSNKSNEMGDKAYRFVEANRGSTKRLMNILQPYMD